MISVMFALLDDHPDAIMMWKDTKYLPNECILKCKHYFSGTYVYVRALERTKNFFKSNFRMNARIIKFMHACIFY